MAHFQVPNGSHSRASGNTFVWDTRDGGIGTITQYKFQVGTGPNFYDIDPGNWIIAPPGGFPPGLYGDGVNLGTGNGTFYVRAQYRKNGQLYQTPPYPFTCMP